MVWAVVAMVGLDQLEAYVLVVEYGLRESGGAVEQQKSAGPGRQRL